MRCATTECRLPRITRSTSLQAVNFKDGMIITADDLATAVAYPLAVFQTLVRSFFGCGIVCGLEVSVGETQPNYTIRVDRGTAIDCHGFPIELCEPVKMNLAPDKCCDWPEGTVCIAIRRITSDEAPRQDCGCPDDCGCKGGDRYNDDCGCKGSHDRGGSIGSGAYQCTRTKDHVLIEAFLAGKRPKNLCASGDWATGGHGCCGDKTADEFKHPSSFRDCMTSCPDCDCCGDAWVLLDCFKVSEKGVVRQQSQRKYVKPIECIELMQSKMSEPAPALAPTPAPAPSPVEPRVDVQTVEAERQSQTAAAASPPPSKRGARKPAST